MLFRRSGVPMVRGGSSGERLLRFMLLLAVFMATGWLFWMQTGKSLEQIQERSMIVDRTGVLTREQRAMLREMGLFLRDEFGQDLKIVVGEEPVSMPELDSKTIFVGLCPSERQVLIDVPPLVRSRLAPDFVLEMQSTFFPPYFDDGSWPTGLLEAVKTIIEQLTGVDEEQLSSFPGGGRPCGTAGIRDAVQA